MTRSATRRSGAVQPEKSPHPAPPVAPSDTPSTPATMRSNAPWFWRFVLFIWITSFAALLLYEWLAAILKSWAKP